MRNLSWRTLHKIHEYVYLTQISSVSHGIYLPFSGSKFQISAGWQCLFKFAIPMCSKVAASHTSLYWTVYQYLIKLGHKSFKLPLNYTQRKCLVCRMPEWASKLSPLQLEASLKYIYTIPSPSLLRMLMTLICLVTIVGHKKCQPHWPSTHRHSGFWRGLCTSLCMPLIAPLTSNTISVVHRIYMFE